MVSMKRFLLVLVILAISGVFTVSAQDISWWSTVVSWVQEGYNYGYCTFAPDSITLENGRVIDISSACRTHDYAYIAGGNQADKDRADWALRNELISLGVPPNVANLYLYAVQQHGASRFKWR
jgi:hypothetical protein